jgi:hypothetical protein
MMTSEAAPSADRTYVWVWLPGAAGPVVAGLLRRDVRGGYGFVYGRSYLGRDDAISLFPDELPLKPGEQRQRDDDLPSSLRDASPDAWGTPGHRQPVDRTAGGRCRAGRARRTDLKAEYLAMRLAHRTGLDVAPVSLTRALGRDVLLIERFDRVRQSTGWQRRAMLSALTLLGLRELEARYASYEDLAHRVRRDFADPRRTLEEIYGRMVGNTDDHARNHAAFWDGRSYRLTPAYDLCPQPRTGGEASQAMLLTGQRGDSRLTACLAAAPAFGLAADQARALIDAQVAVILRDWETVCGEAGLTLPERRSLWRRQFLNPHCLEGYALGITIPDR